MNAKWLRYIIRFLLGDDLSPEIVSAIGYTSNPTLFAKYNVVIIPSGFFDESCYGHLRSIPVLPLREIEGIPLLFGTPEVEMVGATLVVKADIIASTYFLITRYEEIIRRNVRDEHGRFPGKESLPCKAGFIDRPVVDEYRLLLRRWLRQTHLNVPDIKKEIRRVWLTHDVDAPFLYRFWRGVFRSLRDGRGIKQSFAGKFGTFLKDPYYTFPWIFEQDSRLIQALGKKRCQDVYFFRGGGKTQKDKPHYNLQCVELQHLLSELELRQAAIGLHASYEAGINPVLLLNERKTLRKATRKKIRYNRHHFLACREPEDMLHLEAAGITHDFTMGYADMAGFRLGTAWPVQWINPTNKRLSPILLHPLHIMDGTLDDARYMGLSFTEAQEYCLRLIERIKKTGGELSLLWHNSSLAEGGNNYQRPLYAYLIDQLSGK